MCIKDNPGPNYFKGDKLVKLDYLVMIWLTILVHVDFVDWLKLEFKCQWICFKSVIWSDTWVQLSHLDVFSCKCCKGACG